MRALIFDPFAGISGDMTLGALADLGLPVAWIADFVRDLDLADVRVRRERVVRCGMACTKVDFELPEEHVHRHLRDVLAIVERSRTSVLAKQRSAAAFRRIAQAEATVHGTSIENVHFHEVGALDSILDVLCTMAAVEQLGFEAFFTRPVAVGSGWIEIAHGRYPAPAPATLKILEGVPLTGSELEGECTTPTGAAILVTLTEGHAPPAEFVAERSGFGAGTRDPENRPNCIRLLAAHVQEHADALLQIQTDVDDMPAEYLPIALDAVLAAGALDAMLVPVTMKKRRPGTRIEALAPRSALDAVVDALFRSTSTLGVRYWPVTRSTLARVEETVEWRGQRIRRKRAVGPDGSVRLKPEFEDVARAAEMLGLTPWEVRIALDREAPPPA